MWFSVMQSFSSSSKQTHQTLITVTEPDLLFILRSRFHGEAHPSFFCCLSLPQTPSVARSHPRHTDVTTNPRGACLSSMAASAGPFPSAHSSSILTQRVPKLSWTSLRRQSRGRPVSATPSPSATGPSPCMSKSASRYFFVRVGALEPPKV